MAVFDPSIYGMNPDKAVKTVHEHLVGSFLMSEWRAGILARFVGREPGFHADIGSFHGGSAILAALMGSDVITIDKFNGYYGRIMPEMPGWVPVTPSTVKHNAKVFGVNDQITILEGTYRRLKEFPEHYFNTAFLDSEHEGQHVHDELEFVATRVKRYIIVDDTDDNYPDRKYSVQEFHWNIVASAQDEDGRGITVLQRP